MASLLENIDWRLTGAGAALVAILLVLARFVLQVENEMLTIGGGVLFLLLAGLAVIDILSGGLKD